ncbi:MAG: hypothetical protein AAF432_00765 [Planctomycetota bacterium]
MADEPQNEPNASSSDYDDIRMKAFQLQLARGVQAVAAVLESYDDLACDALRDAVSRLESVAAQLDASANPDAS